MRIAILGWGSLINEPGGLPIVGEWQPDGPKLWTNIHVSRNVGRVTVAPMGRTLSYSTALSGQTKAAQPLGANVLDRQCLNA